MGRSNSPNRAHVTLIGGLDHAPHMTPRELEEYRALRATIRERGTARHWILVAGLLGWAALTIALGALSVVPVDVLVPLLVLVGTFEAVFALHTGVERVGRYLQVHYEAEPGTMRWEHTAMQFGRAYGGGSVMDALFSPIFWAATVLNMLPAIGAGPVPMEWTFIGAIHALFAWRVWSARKQAGTQRARDLERFLALAESTRNSNTTSHVSDPRRDPGGPVSSDPTPRP